MIFVHTLGRAIIDVGETHISPSAVRKFAMLLYLWAKRGHRVPKSSLQELIFPDQPERNGKHSLRELVYQFRQLGVRFESDSVGIELLSTDARSDYADILASDRLQVHHLEAAEGGFLPGYAPDHSAAFTEWLEGYRAWATIELTKAILRETERGRAAGDWATTARAARACLALDPLNEEATLALAETLAMCGSKASAVELLDRYIKEVGKSTFDIRLPAALLRKRISERLPESFKPNSRLPFVGRGRELLALREQWDSSRFGQSHCTIVSGDAGIGKTRLAQEFVHVAALSGARLQHVSSQPHDADRPMGAFVDLVPALLQLPGTLGCKPASLAVLTRLGAQGLDIDSPPLDAMQLDALSSSMSAAIADLTDAITSECPLILAFDDAHWLDRLSALTIGALVASPRSKRLFVLITTRDHRQFGHAFRHADRVSLLQLGGLDAQAAIQLTASAIGSADSANTALCDQIAARSGGNPLYLVALATHSRNSGSALSIPDSLRELLTRRLAAVSHRALGVLQTCVSFGRHCTLERVVGALDAPQADMLAWIAELAEARLLESEGIDIRAAHPLIAEALRDYAAPAWFALVNRRVASRLERDAEQGQSPSLWWDCAERWIDAGDPSRAFFAFRTCARHALEIGRPAEAARILDRAMQLLPSSDLILEAARELVSAADLAMEPELVLTGARALKSRHNACVHDSVELAEIKAKICAYQDNLTVAHDLSQCVVAQDATFEHRVYAATALLKFADVVDSNDLRRIAEDQLAAKDLASVNPIARLEYNLVRATTNDSLDAAATIAKDLIKESQLAPVHIRLATLRNTAFALWRAGDVRTSIDCLVELYHTAQQQGYNRSELYGATQLAGMEFDLGNESLASEWIARGEQVVSGLPELESEFDWILIKLDIGLSVKDVSHSTRTFQEANDTLHVFDSSEYRRRWKRAIELRLKCLTGSVHSSDLVEAQALGTLSSRESTGIRDFEVTAVCETLIAFSRQSEAAQQLQKYIQLDPQRRRPLAGSLRRLMQESGARA
jgi:DNA-binding SARP family transcriptional activator